MSSAAPQHLLHRTRFPQQRIKPFNPWLCPPTSPHLPTLSTPSSTILHLTASHHNPECAVWIGSSPRHAPSSLCSCPDLTCSSRSHAALTTPGQLPSPAKAALQCPVYPPRKPTRWDGCLHCRRGDCPVKCVWSVLLVLPDPTHRRPLQAALHPLDTLIHQSPQL